MTLRNQLKNYNANLKLEDICDHFHKIDFPKQEDLKKISNEHLFNWIIANKTSNKAFSRKAKLRILNQKFHLHLKDIKTHLFFRVTKCLKKQLCIASSSLNYISTNKGILYFQRIGESNDCFFCFYAHFFDRIGERILDEKNRDSTIKEYVYNMMDYDYARNFNLNISEVQIYQSNGIILGNFGTIKQSENKYKIIAYNTFISMDMLKADQKEMWEKAKTKKLKSEYPNIVLYGEDDGVLYPEILN